jgi:hypothetical protein
LDGLMASTFSIGLLVEIAVLFVLVMERAVLVLVCARALNENSRRRQRTCNMVGTI